MYYPSYLRWANILNCRLKVCASYITVVVSLFLHNVLGCGSLPFQHWFDGTSVSYEKQSYREIFKSCLTSHEGMADIKIDELDHVQVCSSSWTTQHRIVLSCDLLPWISVEGGIHCSLAYQARIFIIPKLQNIRSFYAIILGELFSLSLSLLSWALPTESWTIFYLLRSIRSECLVRDYSAGFMLDTLEVIIKWFKWMQPKKRNPFSNSIICFFVACLELDAERPSGLYERFKGKIFWHKKAFHQLWLSIFDEAALVLLVCVVL